MLTVIAWCVIASGWAFLFAAAIRGLCKLRPPRPRAVILGQPPRVRLTSR